MPAYSLKTIQPHLRAADAATLPADKGKAIEDLTCYLFGKVPGIPVVVRNKKNQFATKEVDVACWNDQAPTGLKGFDTFLLIECKNWSKPVGSEEVSWFIQKIKHRSLRFGILLAMNGITGDAENRKEAHHTVSLELAHAIRMIVVTRSEIDGLRTTEQFVQLLKEKVCDLLVSGTVWP